MSGREASKDHSATEAGVAQSTWTVRVQLVAYNANSSDDEDDDECDDGEDEPCFDLGGAIEKSTQRYYESATAARHAFHELSQVMRDDAHI